MYENLLLENDQNITIVTLNRPDKLNAWHRKMREEVRNCFETLNKDKNVSAVVLTGAGERAFCAGADLKEVAHYTSADEIRASINHWRAFYEAIRTFTKPVVTALNGVAAGSGFQFTLMTDVRIGHPKVRVGQPEVNSGIPSVTGSMLMTHIAGRSHALELALTGRLMEADEAHRYGFIHEIVSAEKVREHALKRAQELAAKPAIAVRLTKQWFYRHTKDEFEEAWTFAGEAQAEAFSAGEMGASIGQFFEQRGGAKTK